MGGTHGLADRDIVTHLCHHVETSVGHFHTVVVGDGYGVVANGDGDGGTCLAVAPQIMIAQIVMDGQVGGLVRTDAILARDVEEGRDDYRLGSEAYHVAPVAGAVSAAIGADLDRVGRLGIEPAQSVGICVDIDEVGLVAVDADLPFGGVAALGPR